MKNEEIKITSALRAGIVSALFMLNSSFVLSHIERADRHGLFPDFRQNVAQPTRERHPARGNADEHDLRADFVALGDFVRDARERALDRDGIEDDGGFRHEK